MTRAGAIYAALLRAYPAPFRHEYGREMWLAFEEQLRDARRRRARGEEISLWTRTAWDLCTVAPREHGHVITQDLRLAWRTMKAKPAFPVVAMLSLALGIGANTAIFNLWHRVLRAPLPGVDRPEELVMLTDPQTQGFWRGRWDSRTDGQRPWVTYAEFQELRDHATAFSALMASQSSFTTWPLRVGSGAVEEARGRLVSAGFFDVLGVRPAMGRLFTAANADRDAASAVISHAYWQRRFGGRADALGTTLTVRDTPVTVIGVAAAGFVGEDAGQRPDVWLPLELQPRVVPGADWLQERAPEKVMWLHLFGRLRPGITMPQAEAQASAIFQAGLRTFYGSERSDFFDQRLLISSAERGVAATLAPFSASVTLLLASVGVLLLMACANLANLLLARGAARRQEIAIRLSLGASRARLVRQLMTENLALALASGGAAIGVAFLLHGGLVRMLQQADSDFSVGFGLGVPVLGFALGATLVAALAIGLLPACQMTKARAGGCLEPGTRGSVGSMRELRAGRWVVGLQLALSLPLLVGAGLLARTVYNLQHTNVGFDTDRLVLARVALGEITADVGRRDRALRELQARVGRIPGVETVSFSQLGLYGGGRSNAVIEVDGSPLTAQRGQESNLDRVGAGYFTTLGVPIRLGRDIGEGDLADSPRVCVINEAFARRYLDGRHPIGLRVTTMEDDGVRTPYEIVGVAADARLHRLRGDVEPQFFVPAEQRGSANGGRTLLIRTGGAGAGVPAAVREAVRDVDAALAVASIRSLDEQMVPLTAESRTIARLAAVFGTVALALAAIGLYGVLSHAISRRGQEIAIRLAVGARPGTVIAMILRESGTLVAASLAVGGVLVSLGSRLVASRLYGVAAHDPLTLSVALGMLLLVAFVAMVVPAWRGARMNPIEALRA